MGPWHHFHPLIAIFSITFALLVDEILLSSIFHVLIGSGNTAAAISVAFLGLSSAGVVAYLDPRFRERDRAARLYPTLLFGFGVALMGSSILIMNVPLNQLDVAFSSGTTVVRLWTLIVYLLAAIPFFLGGLAINVILHRYSAAISRVYFADLTGAALGCVASPFLLSSVGAPAGILYSAVPALLVAASAPARRGAAQRLLFAVPAALLVLPLLAPGLHRFQKLNTMGEVHSPDRRSFFIDEGDIEFEKWALDAWTIIRSERIPQQWENFEGWGLSRHYRGAIPRIRLINYNSRFSTYVTEYDGDFDEIGEWLDHDLISSHYLLGRRFESVLVIGAGGGREVLNALHHDARRVTAVDISDVVIDDIMKGYLREFSGDLYFDPRVEAIADEGRSFVERSAEPFDLIDFSIVGGMNLEKMDLVRIDDLFTLEALRSYLGRLAADGVFSYVMYSLRSERVEDLLRRESPSGVPYVPALKTLTGLRMAFEERFPGADFRDHVLIAGIHGLVMANYDLVHIVASKSPFSDDERRRFAGLCRDLGFVAFYPRSPGFEETPGLYGRIVETDDLQRTADSLPFSIWPATDDIPFHYAFDGKHLRQALQRGELVSFLAGNPLISLAVTMGVLALIVTVAPLLWLVVAGARELPDLRRSWSLLLFFACLGYGYMAVEIAALLKLQLYLGKPIYGLSVALFTFLFASGLGSGFTHRLRGRRLQVPICAIVALVVAAGLVFFLLSGVLFAHTMALPLLARIGIAVAAIVPLAFPMGMLFPLGIKLVTGENPDLIPWVWAINGCLSVMGIFGTRTLSLFVGFDRALLVGLLAYLVVAVCVSAYSHSSLAAPGPSHAGK
jgi:SAM-dependent methyltransferase